MVQEILRMVFGAAAALLGGALLLRAYLGWLRFSRTNPLVVFCTALTEWLVGPLRRLVPLRGRIDSASLAGALVVAAVFVLLLFLIGPEGVWHWYLFVPSVLLLLVRWALWLVMFLVIFNVLFSLINPHAPLAPTFEMLARPILAPLRRVIPPVGGFDLSPLVLVIIVQVALLVLDAYGA